MALYNKFGSVLKQSVSVNGPASMFNAIRAMSSKLFVGGLAWGTDENSLRDAFASHGEVIEARVIIDRDTGRSRGFGFVSFSSDEAASSALQAMDGQELQGRNIRVSYANERQPRTGGGFGGGYGGGYGGGFGDRAAGGDNY